MKNLKKDLPSSQFIFQTVQKLKINSIVLWCTADTLQPLIWVLWKLSTQMPLLALPQWFSLVYMIHLHLVHLIKLQFSPMLFITKVQKPAITCQLETIPNSKTLLTFFWMVIKLILTTIN